MYYKTNAPRPRVDSRVTMPAFTATYSQEARRALFRAVLVDGMTTKAALRAAAAGELPDLSAEDQADLARMGYSYACRLIKEEEHARDGVQRARSAPGTVTKDVATLLLRRAQKDAQKIANAQKGLMDADAALKVLRVTEACQKVLANLEPKRNANAEKDNGPKAPLSLAQRIAAGSNAEPDDNHTEPNADGSQATPTISDDDTQTDEANAGPALLNAASLGPPAAGPLNGASAPVP